MEQDTEAPTSAGAWPRQAWRGALLQRPDWQALHIAPLGLALLVALGELAHLALDRLYLPGPASFYSPALGLGWLWPAAMVAVCWLMRGQAAERPDTPTLFALLWLQGLLIELATALVFVPTLHAGLWQPGGALAAHDWLRWLPTAWGLAAALVLLARVSPPVPALRGGAFALFALALAVSLRWEAPRYWYPEVSRDSGPPRARITPEQIEAQPALLQAQLNALAPQRPGVIDLYALSFAPYAEEDVFKRESQLVADVMATRFDARGRTLQLVNHARTLETLPLATGAHLKAAIDAVAARMDRDEDVLFIHLTSHGAANGTLAASLWPLDVAPLRPEQLKAWLDAAGVKWRVISVSACYSGTWLEPLADAQTLVMTAADREHTSYGCGTLSELTFFGRAMFDEQLRRTWSFEQAHAAARGVIEQREREAGKDDGYSNPQLAMGAGLRPTLARLEEQLATRPKP